MIKNVNIAVVTILTLLGAPPRRHFSMDIAPSAE